MAHFTGFFDDAALFPPGNAPMALAVPRHWEHRSTWYQDTVGPFVCPRHRLAELHDLLAGHGPRLEVAVIIAEGPAALAAGVCEATAHPRVRLRAVELPAHGELRALPNMAVPEDVTVYAEVPLTPDALAEVPALTGTGLRLKFRTGGTRAQDFPDEPALAAALACAVRHGVPFKLTAGLHHAIRHTGHGTGFEHHGFLNVLAATAAAQQGADKAAITDILACREAETVVNWCTPTALAAARPHFVSFGTCSIDEPVTDLVALGLLEKR
ncbi:hypothetical protein [Acrocarpospora catenulata]|uniref:hypothetical protein n=1 Tax=Acrocarpospora catenulata TaxID=2836182 RepID=UPI001BDB6B1A|nr:hypothetical protein [Acrocarpospora catenulata]